MKFRVAAEPAADGTATGLRGCPVGERCVAAERVGDLVISSFFDLRFVKRGLAEPTATPRLR
jgi:hypothetical protein